MNLEIGDFSAVAAQDKSSDMKGNQITDEMRCDIAIACIGKNGGLQELKSRGPPQFFQIENFNI